MIKKSNKKSIRIAMDESRHTAGDIAILLFRRFLAFADDARREIGFEASDATILELIDVAMLAYKPNRHVTRKIGEQP